MVYDQAIYPAQTSIALVKATSHHSSADLSNINNPTRMIRKSDFKELKNPLSNAVVSLAIETAKSGFGTLIFCSARQTCQTTATLLSQAMPIKMGSADEILDKRENIVSELRALSVGIDETLEKTVIKGVAFHRPFYITSRNITD